MLFVRFQLLGLSQLAGNAKTISQCQRFLQQRALEHNFSTYQHPRFHLVHALNFLCSVLFYPGMLHGKKHFTEHTEV